MWPAQTSSSASGDRRRPGHRCAPSPTLRRSGVTGPRSPSAPWGRLPRVRPAAGQQLLGERLEHGVLLVGIGDRRRGAEHDDGAIVDRMLEDGACEDDAVEQCHGDARRDALAERLEPCGSQTSRARTGGRRSWRGVSGSRTAAPRARSRDGRREQRRGSRRSWSGRRPPRLWTRLTRVRVDRAPVTVPWAAAYPRVRS